MEVRGYLSFKVDFLHLTFVLERFAGWEEHMAKLMSKSELIQKIADLALHRSSHAFNCPASRAQKLEKIQVSIFKRLLNA